MGKQNKSEKGPEPGLYFFVDTWLGCEVQKCELTAQGLWMNMLCKMFKEDPRGVLPGDPLKLAKKMGKGDVARAWADTMAPLLRELEDEHVFSRGSEIDHGLDPDAIVNRRMYRVWCKDNAQSERNSRNARIRWDKEKPKPTDATRCETPCEGDAKAMRPDGGEAVADKRFTKEPRCDLDAEAMPEKCLSLPDPTRGRYNLPEPRSDGGSSRAGDLAADALQAMASPNGTAPRDGLGGKLFERVTLLEGCKKGDPWYTWFKSSIKAFEEEEHLAVVEEQVTEVEEALDPKKRAEKGLKKPNHPGRVLTTRFLGEARALGIKLPETPTEGRRVAQ